MAGSSDNELSSGREQDKFLPIANVNRLMKRSLPTNAKISKEAKETMQECVSGFISFVTGEASDKCQREKRKTLHGDDIILAMSSLGFDSYIEPLRLYLQRYRVSLVNKHGDRCDGHAASSGGGGGGGESIDGGGGGQRLMMVVESQGHVDSFGGGMSYSKEGGGNSG